MYSYSALYYYFIIWNNLFRIRFSEYLRILNSGLRCGATLKLGQEKTTEKAASELILEKEYSTGPVPIYITNDEFDRFFSLKFPKYNILAQFSA
jgi:hypothetical protein